MEDRWKAQFIKILSKLKVVEFPKVLDFVFGDELPWAEVKRIVDEKRVPKRPKNLAVVCWNIYQMSMPSREEAFFKLWRLELSETAIHSRRTWFGLRLTDPFPDFEPSWDDIEENLVKEYKNELRTAHVTTLLWCSLLYVMVVEETTTKKSKKSKLSTPTFFVYDVNLASPFAFFTPKLSKNHPLACLSTAVGYQSYEVLKFSGEDVNSLYGAVQRKMAGTVALRPPPFIPEPIEYGYVRDLTGFSQREDYANRILPGSTKFKVYTVQSRKDRCGTSDVPDISENNTISSKLTIQTTGDTTVEDVLRHLIVRGNISIPPPSWVMNIANEITNHVTLGEEVPEGEACGAQFSEDDF